MDAIASGSRSPVASVAKQLGETYSADYVRDVLYQARSRGLLTPPKVKGRAGGDLTEKARTVLSEEAP